MLSVVSLVSAASGNMTSEAVERHRITLTVSAGLASLDWLMMALFSAPSAAAIAVRLAPPTTFSPSSMAFVRAVSAGTLRAW